MQYFIKYKYTQLFWVGVFFLFQCSVAFGQSRNQYNLLWKITGNKLSRPSYLFGTMHVRDKNAFEFSDSVLTKLDEADGFAMEVTPDSILKVMFQTRINSLFSEERYDIKKHLSKEEYDMLSERLQEEAGVSLKDMKNQAPWIIESLLGKQVSKKDDKATFVDAHLYKLSKQQGKQIIGLEDVEDQINTVSIDDVKNMIYAPQLSESKEREMQDKFVQIYYEGNVENLYQYMKNGGMSDEHEYKLLIKRNIKMVERLEGLMASKSFFVAVGAGHLAGEKGMIALLKKRGYTVTPVNATFTGMAARYKEKVLVEQWQNFEPAEGLLSVELPSQPFAMSTEMDEVMKMHVYPDIGTGQYYYVMTVAVPKDVNSTQGEVFLKKMAEEMAGKNTDNKLIENKTIRFQEVDGYEMSMRSKKENMYMRMRIFAQGKIIYMMLFGGAKEAIKGANAERFFNSLRMIKPKATGWQEASDEIGAFKVRAPAKLKKMPPRDIANEETKIKITMAGMSGNDNITGISYGVLHFTYQIGMFLEDEKYIFESMKQNTLQSIKGELISEREGTTPEGFPYKDFQAKDKARELIYQYRIYIRGSRPYAQLAIIPIKEIENPDIKDFFNSFQFTDYKKLEWEEISEEQMEFAIKVPLNNGEISWEADTTDSDKETKIWYSQSQASGTTYSMVVNTFSKYEYYENVDSLYDALTTAYIRNNQGENSILSSKSIDIKGLPAREVLVQTEGNHNIRRLLYIVQGNKLYNIIAALPKSEVEHIEPNLFFNSLKLKGTAKTELFTPKIELLLSDLSSRDTAVAEKAKNALLRYDFKKNDLPQIYQALDKKYEDDTLRYGSTRGKLFDILEQVQDEQVLDFIKKIYPTLPTEYRLRIDALNVLAHINTKESIVLLKQLLPSLPVGEKNYSFSLLNSSYDSLKSYQYFFPEIMNMLDNEEYRQDIIRMVAKGYEDKILGQVEMEKCKPYLLGMARNAFAIQKNAEKDNYTQIPILRQSAKILAHYPNDAECKKLLYELLDCSNNWVALDAMTSLLKNKFVVSKKHVEELAAKEWMLLEVYNALEKYEQLSLFPKKMLKQELFAESILKDWLSEEDYYNENISLQKVQEIEHNGTKVRVFFYKIIYKSENEETNEKKEVEYGGICGIFSLDKNKVKPIKTFVRTTEESLSKSESELSALVQKLLKDSDTKE